jgi:hypothetical protein
MCRRGDTPDAPKVRDPGKRSTSTQTIRPKVLVMARLGQGLYSMVMRTMRSHGRAVGRIDRIDPSRSFAKDDRMD